MLSKILLVTGGVVVLGLGVGLGVGYLSQPDAPTSLIEPANPIKTAFAKISGCRGSKVPHGFTSKNKIGKTSENARWDAFTLKKYGRKHALSHMQNFSFYVTCSTHRDTDTNSLENAEYACLNAKDTPEFKLEGCSYGERNGFVYLVKQGYRKSKIRYTLEMQNKTHRYEVITSDEQAKPALSRIFSTYIGKVPEAIMAVTNSQKDEMNSVDGGTVASAQPLPRKKLTLKGCKSPVQMLKGIPLSADSSGTKHHYWGGNASQNQYTSALRKGKITIAEVSVSCKEMTQRERAQIILISTLGIGSSCEKVKKTKKAKGLVMCEMSKTKKSMTIVAAKKKGKLVDFRLINLKAGEIIEVVAVSKLSDRKAAIATFRQVAASFVKP